MRERAAHFADSSGIGALLRRLPLEDVVLTYHRIGEGADSPYDRAAWDATEAEFDEQLAFLASSCEVVGPRELLARTARGRRRRPRVVITFDDGYRDNHDLALPLLRRHGLTATFFVTTGFIDEQRPAWWDELAWMARRSPREVLELPELGSGAVVPGEAIPALLEAYKRMADTKGFLDRVAEATGSGRHPADSDTWMSWEMVRALRDAGMTIGGHSATHPILARLDAEGQRAEVQRCAQRLEQELGSPMRFFSYPVGLPDCFDGHTRAALREAGVELAFSLYGVRGRGWDPYDVRRCSVGRASAPRFRMMLSAPRLFATA